LIAAVQARRNLGLPTTGVGRQVGQWGGDIACAASAMTLAR